MTIEPEKPVVSNLVLYCRSKHFFLKIQICTLGKRKWDGTLYLESPILLRIGYFFLNLRNLIRVLIVYCTREVDRLANGKSQWQSSTGRFAPFALEGRASYQTLARYWDTGMRMANNL